MQFYLITLQNLTTGIESLGYSNMEVFNAVMGRLQEFKKSCDAKSSGISFSSQPTRINLNLPAHPVYEKLTEIFVGATDQQDAKFDCGLETRPEFKDHIKGGIFADFRVAKSMGKTLSDIRIWNNYSLNSLRQDEALGKTIKNQCQNIGYLYLTPETIFYRKISNVLPGGDKKT